jgi:lipopolysaccharide/colanic/teichoic acid biosynthesis glycosyltransferase
MALRGVPSRDIPIEGGSLDLGEERGLLAANERFLMDESGARGDGKTTAFLRLVAPTADLHETARLIGPIVIQDGASIEANVTIVGPAVIGEGARIGAGAVVAHATVGAGCVVPPHGVVRDRAWFRGVGDPAFGATERAPMSFSERLARLSIVADDAQRVEADQQTSAGTTYLSIKRALDVALAAGGLVLLSPLLLLVAIAIWLESKGPIFYGDTREGLGGRVFKCWKFRTMFTGAHRAQRELKGLDQTDGPHFKIDRDPRVTRVGRLLRTLNVDEVPQLFNVLCGTMSLVGPRPSPFRENQVCVPWRSARLSVRPGMTGFWQVCRHNRAAGDFHQWIEYDLLYVQHLSFWLDAKILAVTALTLGGKLAHVPSAWLTKGEPVQNLEFELVPPEQTHAEAERVA